jgi:DNA helicase IV
MADYYYNFPPFDDLNDAQKAAVRETRAIGLSGGPGTGKSVVSLWRHIINHTKENPVRSQLLTYTTTLAYYLKSCCKTKDINSANSVESTLKWFNGKHKGFKKEIILDEAQDLSIKFNKLLFELTDSLSYGADNQQILAANATNPDGKYDINVCSPEKDLEELLQNPIHRLDKNYRSTQRIMKFAKHFFKDAFIHHQIIDGLADKIGEYPRMLITNGNINKQNEAVVNIIRQYTNNAINIGVLLPFANMPWENTEHWTAKYYFEILNGTFDCSYYDNTLKGIEELKNIHITPFKSAKGLEFDIVIIPNFHLVNEKFKVVNWRDFFVGVTRAKSQLILLCDNDIPIVNQYVEKVIL